MTTFDYVIVGAGSAGCVLANRLTADGRSTVLLLEAGPRDKDFWIHVPLGYGKLFARTDVNWAYQSEPEPALNGRRVFTPRGKVLGGSSSINGLVHIRGQREDYDGWGVPGWGFDDLLPYFKKSEDHCRGASEWHGAGGPIAVSDLPDRHEMCDAFIASAMALGIPRNDDFNGATQEGTGYYQATARNGRRCSTAVGYLRPAEKRPNLRVEVEALATRVLFEGKRATGVVYEARGAKHEARAAREVILAGGTINTPQLLQLSGVGPRALLERHGIALVHDAPGVGEDLQDHFYCRTFWRCTRPITLNDDMMSVWRQAKIGLQYLLFRRGPLTVSAGYAGAFVRTRPEIRRPDAQIYFINFSTAKRGGVLHPFSGFTLSVSQTQVESRGSVHIASRRSAHHALDPLQLSRHRERPPRDGGRPEARPAHRRHGAAARLRSRGGVSRPARAERRGLARLLPRSRRYGVPPDFDLPHGNGRTRGGRSTAARARCRGAACRRCVGHAGRALRQHQRDGDRGGGEGG